MGNTALHYKVVQSNPYWFALVVGNHAVPLEAVSAQFKPGGEWVPLQRSTQNQWQYSGEWGTPGAPPMRLRLTSITGEVVEDVMPAVKGGAGKVQFTKYDRPTGLPPLAPVWPGYGKPWAERVFPGVAAKGPTQPRPAAKKAPAAAGAQAPAVAPERAHTVAPPAAKKPAVGPGEAAAVRPPPNAATVERALQVGGAATAVTDEDRAAATEAAVEVEVGGSAADADDAPAAGGAATMTIT